MANLCADVVEEIPVQAPWSFGPIPPGQVGAPSYAESVQIGVDWAVDWLLANPNRTFMLGGYSQGGEAASRIYGELLPGGRLESLSGNFVGGFTFGNPCRQRGHSFYAGPDRPERGISTWNQTDMGDWWADECEACDMYANVPTDHGQIGGDTAELAGQIMTDVYTLCIELQLHSPAEMLRDLIANCLAILGDLDGDAYAAQRLLVAPVIDLSGAQVFNKRRRSQIIQRNRLLTVKGIAAAIMAIVRGIEFVATQPATACHIEYQLRTWNGSQTYVLHAAQHVRDYAARRTPLA